MTVLRPLSRLMAVVIVMITVAFGASVAQAHEGHAHQGVPAATVHHHASPAPVTVTSDNNRVVSVVFAETAMGTPTVRLLSATGPRAKMLDEHPCNGVCCSMGATCCVPGAMLPAASTALPASTAAERMIAAPEPFLAGIAREALPKPPRSIA